jgi:DNA-binding CsgD family transcriptional regulator
VGQASRLPGVGAALATAFVACKSRNFNNSKTASAGGENIFEKIIKEIDTTLKVQEDWKQFEHHFDQIHGDFLKRLTREFTDLTPGEQKLCAFLRLNMDTKEIANLMAISSRGVEVTRYRLRKKFKLDTHQNLSKFILEY